MGTFKKIHSQKAKTRLRRKRNIRKRISGTPEKPRLSVFRSNTHIYAQAIDDTNNAVLASSSDMEKSIRSDVSGKNKTDLAKIVGESVGKKLMAKNINSVVFDRNGFIYHGRVKAVADGAREAGLKF